MRLAFSLLSSLSRLRIASHSGTLKRGKSIDDERWTDKQCDKNQEWALRSISAVRQWESSFIRSSYFERISRQISDVQCCRCCVGLCRTVCTVRFANIIGESMNSTRAYNQDATSGSKAAAVRLFSIFFQIEKEIAKRSPKMRSNLLSIQWSEMCIKLTSLPIFKFLSQFSSASDAYTISRSDNRIVSGQNKFYGVPSSTTSFRRSRSTACFVCFFYSFAGLTH